MSKYVIRNKTNRKFVTKPTSTGTANGLSFTDDVSRADTFATAKEAWYYACSDEEVITTDEALTEEKAMDQDMNLREQLTLANFLADAGGTNEGVKRLAELVLCMDRWLAEGGPLPVRWERK